MTVNKHTSKETSIASKSRSSVFGLSVVLTTSLCLCVLAFYLNVPVPTGIEDPWKYRVYSGIKHFVCDLASLQEILLHRHYPIALRETLDFVLSVSGPIPSTIEGSNIRSSQMEIAGVKVFLYEPIVRNLTTFGASMIFIHGGGFFFGNPEMSNVLVRRIAEELDIVIISIDYRLAPEHIHPAAFEDCLAVTKWLLENGAKSYGLDATRVGITGDSAGGSLAASVAQFIHDDSTLPDLKYQALIYPVSQFLDINTPSQQKYRREFGENGGLATWWEAAGLVSWYLFGESDNEIIAALMENNHTTSIFWRESEYANFVSHSLLPEYLTVDGNYTPLPINRVGSSKIWSQIGPLLLDTRVCPLMRANMTGLPPTFVATCGFDAVRDNGIYYAMRLVNFGVEVDWKHYEGGFHGVFGLRWPFHFKVGERIFQDFIYFIKSHW